MIKISSILFLAATVVQAEITEFDRVPGVYVPYAKTAPVIDGKPDDECWRNATEIRPFIDIRSDKFPEPKFQTKVKMCWDSTNLYILATLEEPDIQGKLTERDAIVYRDNDFEIFIDPDGDGHNYYEIEVNALGTIFDLFIQRPYRTRGAVLFTWNTPGMRHAVHLNGTLNNSSDTDKGWNVEFAIPQAALTFETKKILYDGATWRMNFSRVQWFNGKDHNWVWAPQGEIAMHKPERWGYVTFQKRDTVNNSIFTYPDSEEIQRKLYATFEEIIKEKPFKRPKQMPRGVWLEEFSENRFLLRLADYTVDELGLLQQRK